MKPFPVLLAFFALFSGVFSAGLFGGLCVIGSVLLVLPLATFFSRLQGASWPRGVWALAFIFAVGAARYEASDQSNANIPWPENVSSQDGKVSAEIAVSRVRRRDRYATSAEVVIKAFIVQGERIPSGNTRAILSGPGLLPILKDGSYVVYARLRPPRPEPDHLPPRWPKAKPLPRLSLSGSDGLMELRGPGLSRPSAIDKARFKLTQRLLAALPGKAGDFACAILLGEGKGIAPSTRLALSKLGTAHILAVSGLHVAIAAAVISLVLGRGLGFFLVRCFPHVNLVLITFVFASAAAFGVALIAGAQASAVRAALITAIATLGRWLGRSTKLEACLALAGLIDLILWPSDAFSLSFLLSYAAVLGIAVAHAPLERAWTPNRFRENAVLRLIFSGLAVSTAACVSTTPITYAAFGTASFFAPVFNLIVVPILTFFVMPISLVLLAAAAISPLLLDFVSFAGQVVLEPFVLFQEKIAYHLPAIEDHLGPILIPCALAMQAALWSWALGVKWRFVIVVAGLIFSAAAGPEVGGIGHRRPFKMIFLDAGKGDAILIACPTGKKYLIDTGEAQAFPRILRRLAGYRVYSLDGIVLTHADADHIGAAKLLANALPVKFISMPCQEVARSGLMHEPRVRCIGFGQQALPGCDADSSVLWPPVFAKVEGNSASLVVKVSWAGRTVLLTGDLTVKEEEILAKVLPLQADVLKLGHHGSSTSSSLAFLKAVKPKVAVVSGHASRVTRRVPDSVRRLVHLVDARLVGTEEFGDICVTINSDGTLMLTGQGLFSAFTPNTP